MSRVSVLTRCASMMKLLVSLIVALVTRLPAIFSIGIGLLVSMDSLIELDFLIMMLFTGTFSLGCMRSMSFGCMWLSGMFFLLSFGWMSCVVLGARLSKVLMVFEVWLCVLSFRIWFRSTRVMIIVVVLKYMVMLLFLPWKVLGNMLGIRVVIRL